MSGEHIFSNAIFKAGCSCPIIVDGVKRIRGGAPTYGAEKSNILCRHHNSILSPLDNVAGKIASFQAQSNEKEFEENLYIEGELLERWLLKTVINMAAAGWAGSEKWLPSPEIVEAIFGMRDIPNGYGLYSVDGIDPNHRPSGGVSCIPIHLPTPHEVILAGAYVSVHGMPLFASFHDDLAQRLEQGAIPGLLPHFSEDGLKHLYHPGAIVISRKKGKPVFIGLSWNGLLKFADGSTATFPHTGQQSNEST
ncbi:hypothetical protein [Microbulbifer sp. TRSA007]|uniref:hypothetical protein n=1 Tax=Microbulbifer sp. TRSA007 TaxID=3243384 RepID=UPI00403A4B50